MSVPNLYGVHDSQMVTLVA